MRNAHERLVEWGEEKFYPGWDTPHQTVLGRLVDEGRDERLKARRRKDAKFVRRMKQLGVMVKKKRGAVLQVVQCKESRVGRMEMLTHEGESFSAVPDGGLGAMVDRMAGSIERSRRCREVGEFVDLMPEDMRAIVRAAYGTCATPNDVPRVDCEAANVMGMALRTYERRKAEMLAWLSERLGLRVAVAA